MRVELIRGCLISLVGLAVVILGLFKLVEEEAVDLEIDGARSLVVPLR